MKKIITKKPIIKQPIVVIKYGKFIIQYAQKVCANSVFCNFRLSY